MTPTLFHGPGARDQAVRASVAPGFRPVSEPMGDGGLKVDDSRTLVEVASVAPVGDKKGTLVLGPLDRATPEAADALLKTLEDLAEGPVRLIPWAWDLAGVLPTIRSRTLHQWCPGPDPLLYLKGAAEGLIKAVTEKRLPAVVEALSEINDGEREDLLVAVQGPLLAMGSDGLDVWVRLRPLISGRGVARLPAVVALMGIGA